MRRRLAWSWAFLVVGLRGIAEALWDLVQHPRRVLVVVALLMVMVGGSVASARPAVAQEEGPGQYAPVVGLCLRKILNLPLLDVPDQPIDLMLGGQVSCPARGG